MDKTYWHPAFCGATEWEFKDNAKDLDFDPEHELSKKPLKMDMLVWVWSPTPTISGKAASGIFSENHLKEPQVTAKLSTTQFRSSVYV